MHQTKILSFILLTLCLCNSYSVLAQDSLKMALIHAEMFETLASSERICDSTILIRFDYETGAYLNERKYVNTYDKFGIRNGYKLYRRTDSTSAWVCDSRKIETYYKPGIVKTSLRRNWDNTEKKWVNHERSFYNYGNNWKRNYWHRSVWDIEEQKWLVDYTTYLKFDAQGREVEEYNERLNKETKILEKTTKYLTEYDNNGNKIRYERYSWNKALKAYKGDQKEVWTYREDNQIKDFQSYKGSSTNVDWIWHLEQKGEYTYDEYDRLTQVRILEKSDKVVNNWAVLRMERYAYDSNGNCVDRKYYRKDYYDDRSAVELRQRMVYEFNEKNKLIRAEYYKWDDTKQGVILDNAELYEYFEDNDYRRIDISYTINDTTGQREFLTKEDRMWSASSYSTVRSWNYKYNAKDSTWILTSKFYPKDGERLKEKLKFSEYYNEAGEMTAYWASSFYRIETPYVNTSVHLNKNINSDEWTYHYINKWFYSDQIFEEELDNSNEIILYPNPVSDFLTVGSLGESRTMELFIYDEMGRLKLKKELGERERVNLSALSAGVYFYRIVVEEEEKSGKLLKM